MKGPHFAGRVAVFVSIGFNDTAVPSAACSAHSLNMEGHSASENYFHGVAMFTVSCCLCLKVFSRKLGLSIKTFEPGDERSCYYVSFPG